MNTDDDKEKLLVTTALKEAIDANNEIILLGQWCINQYDQIVIGNGIYEIAKPYGSELSEIEKDSIEIENYERLLLEYLSDLLNKYHNENHSIRYWQIILGHWITRYVTVCWNRWMSIKQIVETKTKLKTKIVKDDNYSLITKDSLSFIYACNNNEWNHVLYSKIIENFDIKKEYITHSLGTGYQMNELKISSFKEKAKFSAKKTIGKILRKYLKNSDALIVGSYLPRMQELALNLVLGQMPQIWNKEVKSTIRPDLELRAVFKRKKMGNISFTDFIINSALEILPVCFLEGYEENKKCMKDMGYPNNPKFIYTCSYFDTDEIEKLYIADKVTKGARYYVGQHGGVYGTAAKPYWYSANESQLLMTCDKFLTWGWHDSKIKCQPAFIFKNNFKKKYRFKKSKQRLLLIETCMLHRVQAFDQYPFFAIYQQQQFDFVSGLSYQIRNDLLVRLNSDFRNHDWGEPIRWKRFDPEITVDHGDSNIYKLMDDSKLIIHSYDGTTLLETLSHNIPTVCFWFSGLSRIRESAIPYYQMLKDAEILFESPIDAARKVNQIWGNVEVWWKSDPVQKARKCFCDQYARTVDHPVKRLKEILISN